MASSGWVSFLCPFFYWVQSVYVYIYDQDPPRRLAGETRNLTLPGGLVRTC